MPGAVVPVGAVVVVVVVVVGVEEPLLGRYLIPVDGQSELEPTSTRVSRFRRKINESEYLGLWE